MRLRSGTIRVLTLMALVSAALLGGGAPAARQQAVRDILSAGEAYGRSDLGRQRRVIVEFVSANPTGPFKDGKAEPLVCQFELGGTIDANPFRDSDGRLYLYYKSDGNRVGKKTAIWGQKLAAELGEHVADGEDTDSGADWDLPGLKAADSPLQVKGFGIVIWMRVRRSANIADGIFLPIGGKAVFGKVRVDVRVKPDLDMGCWGFDAVPRRQDRIGRDQCARA